MIPTDIQNLQNRLDANRSRGAFRAADCIDVPTHQLQELLDRWRALVATPSAAEIRADEKGERELRAMYVEEPVPQSVLKLAAGVAERERQFPQTVTDTGCEPRAAPAGDAWSSENWTKTHELKTWPSVFEAMAANLKPFEIRKDDRGFAVGDGLCLREWSPVSKVYSGREIRRAITYILRGPDAEWFGCLPGYCIMGLRAAEGNQ